jgi:DNA polymerase/3'-5' exonuclease PolX
MSKNDELIRIFNEIADLLDLAGEVRFKADAYRRAARSLESLGEDIGRAAERGDLGSIPGVGEALEEKIREYLRTGHLAYYEKLRSQFPPGVLEIMQLPGVGPKTTRRFLLELHVQSPAELAKAIEEGKLAGMSGFAERKIASIREGLAARGVDGAPTGARHPVVVAWEISEAVVATLRARTRVEFLGVAGSLRRGRETVGDIDVLATSAETAPVLDAFVSMAGVREVRARGDTKATIVMDPGIQVDLRVVAPESFGAALQYFTGSKDHNIRLRTKARDRGLKINEYGVFRGTERIAGATEEEVYAAMGLTWMPPEIRENRGEIEAAERGTIPSLVDPKDLRGDLHVHLTEPSGTALAEWAAAAQGAGFRYLGFVLDVPGPELPAAARALRERWAKLPAPPPVAAFVGFEVGAEAWESPPAGADYYLLRPGPAEDPPPKELPSGAPEPLFVAHLPAPGPPARGRWITWAAGHPPVGLDVSPTPTSEGLDSGEVQRAVAAGCPLFLTSGARTPAELRRIAIAVRLARRGWAEPAHVATTREFRKASPDPPVGARRGRRRVAPGR